MMINKIVTGGLTALIFSGACSAANVDYEKYYSRIKGLEKSVVVALQTKEAGRNSVCRLPLIKTGTLFLKAAHSVGTDNEMVIGYLGDADSALSAVKKQADTCKVTSLLAAKIAVKNIQLVNDFVTDVYSYKQPQ